MPGGLATFAGGGGAVDRLPLEPGDPRIPVALLAPLLGVVKVCEQSIGVGFGKAELT